MRANCLLYKRSYAADEEMSRELIADLLLAIALITRVMGATATILGTGIVEFRRRDRVVSTYLFVSGRGSRGQVAIQSELSRCRRGFQSLATPPCGAIAGGLADMAGPPPSPPADVVLGNNQESIIFGQTAFPIFDVAS